MKQSAAFLPDDRFRQVIESTPLVSIDLILEHNHKVLLGQRLNRPAQGYWFVPGGRIQKNEPLAAAFRRLSFAELGQELNFEKAQLLGAFEHFYSDSVFGNELSTHYVALGYHLKLSHSLEEPPKDQHRAFAWWPINNALADKSVHQHTKDYLHRLIKV